jgi:hypothetical protein
MTTPKELHLAALRRQRMLLAVGPVWTEKLVAVVAPGDGDLDDDALNFVTACSFQAGAQLMLEVGPAQDEHQIRRVFQRLLNDAEKDWQDHLNWRHAKEA